MASCQFLHLGAVHPDGRAGPLLPSLDVHADHEEPRLLQWLAWMELEIDNIRAVLRRCMDHGDSRRSIDLATCLIWYWITRATAEGVRWLDELLARKARPANRPWVYFARGFLAVLQNDPAAARPALERGVIAARAAGQLDALSQLLAMASIAANMAGDRASSKRLLDEARVASDGLDDLATTLMMYQARALNGLLDGDLAAVRSAAAQGARLSREAGDLYSLGMMLLNQGFAALISGDLREAGQQLSRDAAARLALREAAPPAVAASDHGSAECSGSAKPMSRGWWPTA